MRFGAILARLFGRNRHLQFGVSGRTEREAAKLAIRPGGSGGEADVALVREQFRLLPPGIVAEIAGAGIEVIACHDNVVDFVPSLHHVRPEGWPADKYWDDVPGAYLSHHKQVVIATISTSPGVRHVPLRYEGHGSWNLALHELFHGVDHADGTASKTREFRQAWAADEPAIRSEPGSEYFLNAQWGARESFAESGARKFNIDGDVAPHWPELLRYWQAIGSGGALRGEEIAMPRDQQATKYVGSAFRNEEGQLILSLVAQAPGIEGHALFQVTKADEEAIVSRLVQVVQPNIETTPGRNQVQWMVKPLHD